MLTIFNRIIGALALLIVLALLAIWAFSPLAVRQYAPPFLAELGLKMSESSSIRLNPFKGSVTISDFALSEINNESTTNEAQEQNQAKANDKNDDKKNDKSNDKSNDKNDNKNKAVISHAVIDVNFLALMTKRLAFDELDFDDLSITVDN